MIGAAEFQERLFQMPLLGVNSTEDVVLARLGLEGAKRLQRFSIRNTGTGDAAITFTAKKRGASTNVSSENIDALQFGSTNRFVGAFANRRVTEGTVIIVDSNVTTAQRVEDTNGDGDLYQTDGPTGPTYPFKVGTINYVEGTIDFTFYHNVTASTTGDYKHTDWAGFGTAITFDVVAGGAEVQYLIYPGNAENWFDSLKGEEEVGFFAKLKAAGPEAFIFFEGAYFGDDSLIWLPPRKGEVQHYPRHNN